MTSPRRRSSTRSSDFLRTIGVKLAKGQVLKPAHFNGILARVKAARAREHRQRDRAAHARRRRNIRIENFGHFGLNLRRYAHFTSPIRRYADLIVHRALIRALKLGDGGLPDTRGGRTRRNRRAHLRRRAPRHGGRARDRRPPDRRIISPTGSARVSARAFPASPDPACSCG